GVSQSIRAGDVETASKALGAAFDAIEDLESGPQTRMLAARAMLERARLRWLGAGLEPTFTLDGALEAALDAREALGEGAPPRLRADVASVIAGIAYDIGDGASVDRASAVLTQTIADLLHAGARNDAAMLLNDQAALELRIGRGRIARELAMRSLALLATRV